MNAMSSPNKAFYCFRWSIIYKKCGLSYIHLSHSQVSHYLSSQDKQCESHTERYGYTTVIWHIDTPISFNLSMASTIASLTRDPVFI